MTMHGKRRGAVTLASLAAGALLLAACSSSSSGGGTSASTPAGSAPASAGASSAAPSTGKNVTITMLTDNSAPAVATAKQLAQDVQRHEPGRHAQIRDPSAGH